MKRLNSNKYMQREINVHFNSLGSVQTCHLNKFVENLFRLQILKQLQILSIRLVY